MINMIIMMWLILLLLSIASSYSSSSTGGLGLATGVVGGGIDGLLDCTKSVFWLHTPKTASTFCLTLQHLCCPYYYYTLTRDVSLEMLLDQQLIDEHRQQNMSFSAGNGCFTFKRKNYPPAGYNNERHKHKPKEKRNLQERYEFDSDLKQVEDVPMPHVLSAPQRVVDSYTCNMGKLGNHLPLASNIVGEAHPKMTMFAMLREPKMRLISSFVDSMHHEGMAASEYFNMSKQILNITQTDALSNVEVVLQRFRIYTQRKSVFGCQVKMLNGLDCFADVYSTAPNAFNHTALKHAITLIEKQFYFIGLVEHYRTSLTLLYAMVRQDMAATSLPQESHTSSNLYAAMVEEGRKLYGEDFYQYSMQVSEVESLPQRSSNKELEALLLRHVHDFHDPYDSVLYEEAKKLFHKRLRQYLVDDADGATTHSATMNTSSSSPFDDTHTLKRHQQVKSRLRRT